jgi:hypothetical protein
MANQDTGKEKNLPDFITIGGHKVPVLVGQKQELFDRMERLGEFDTATWDIHLSGKMHPTFTRQILIHELLHALFTLAEMPEMTPDLEENICKALENHLYRMLCDNDFSFLRSS